MSLASNFRLVVTTLIAAVFFAGTASHASPDGNTKTVLKQKAPVLAEVNGVAITLDDFNREFNKLSGMQKAIVETPKGRRDMVDSLVTRELAAQRAAKTGFDKDKEFKAQLAHLRKSFTASEYMTKEIALLTPLTDAEIKKHYEENIIKYSAGERIRASNLQVKTEDAAKDILTQIKAGASYEDLARQKSIDAKSSASGGDKGWFDRGTLGEPFDQAVAGLKAGDISDVVKSPQGFHIIKIAEIRAPGTRPLDEAAPMIKEELAPGQRVKATWKVTQGLRKNARIVIKEDALAAMGGEEDSEPKIEIIPIEQPAEPPKQATEPPKQ